MQWPNVEDKNLEIFFIHKALMLTLTGGDQYFIDINYEKAIIRGTGQGLFKLTDEKALTLLAATDLPTSLQSLNVITTTIPQIENLLYYAVIGGYDQNQFKAGVQTIQAAAAATEIRYNLRACFYLIFTDFELFKAKLFSNKLISSTNAYVHPLLWVLYFMFGWTPALVKTIQTKGLYPKATVEGNGWFSDVLNFHLQNLRKQGVSGFWYTDFVTSFLLIYKQILAQLQKA